MKAKSTLDGNTSEIEAGSALAISTCRLFGLHHCDWKTKKNPFFFH
jgi:hypothetical protein